MVGCKHPNVWFFRFGLTSLDTVVFGRFGFFKSDFFYYSILIICHFGHFSFSTCFLNITWYTLFAISWTTVLNPVDMIFLNHFLFNFRKNSQHSSCFIVPGNVLHFPHPRLTHLAIFGCFPMQK